MTMLGLGSGALQRGLHALECQQHHHMIPSLQMGFLGHHQQSLCWNPSSATRRLQKCRMKVLITIASSVYEDTLPSSTSHPGNNRQAASFTPPPSAATSARGKSALQRTEELIEQAIFNCRFLTLLGILGSLAGSVLCFFKGCTFVVESFLEYFHTCWNGIGTGKVILLLVEAVDVYLMGTVMLIFGMGLYELFVSSLDVPGGDCFSSGSRTTICGSNLFGLFRLRERPKWLEIRSLDELKTKLGHVIVMILLVGMFEKSKKVPVHSGVDLLCFSASILLSSGSLFLLSKLHSTN